MKKVFNSGSRTMVSREFIDGVFLDFKTMHFKDSITFWISRGNGYLSAETDNTDPAPIETKTFTVGNYTEAKLRNIHSLMMNNLSAEDIETAKQWAIRFK